MTPKSPRRPTLPTAPRSRLADFAHDTLRKSIVEGQFQMGQRLIEVQLADELQMSRAPVREALRRLLEEGLVDDSPHRGMHVREFGPDDLIDLYNARLAIEPIALRLFMRNGASTLPLARAVEEMHKAAKRGSSRRVAEAELAFHAALVEGSGNKPLIAMFGVLSGQLSIGLAIDDAEYDDLELIASEHTPIIESIEAGNEKRAVKEFERHIIGSIGDVIKRQGGDPRRLLKVP